MITNYKQFIKSINESLKEEMSPKLSDKFKEIKEVLLELIEKSLNTSDAKTFEDFIEAFIKNSEETQIEGLINDSDIYEFYLKYRNDIDEILSEVNFYDKKPSELNVFGVYDYIIKSTKEVVSETIKMIKSDLGAGGQPKQEI